MLVFNVYHNGKPAKTVDLNGANLIGIEGTPIRAEIAGGDGQVTCLKRAPGCAALALLWDAGPAGQVLLKTTRLPDRKEPYNLNLELARARIATLLRKREDWGLIGFSSGAELENRFAEIRRKFVQAVKINFDDPAGAAALADTCLQQCITLSEETALFHADIFLVRRRKMNRGRPTFGCGVDINSNTPEYQKRLVGVADFINLPTRWKTLENKEGELQTDRLDSWVDWCFAQRVPLSAGPLISFEPNFFPERIFLYEHDFQALRDIFYEHIRKLVGRYAEKVATWKVISGAHAFNHFNLNFEQIMELTRMTCSLVRTMAPKASIAIELAMPWGEYHGSNPRTMPPMTYVDMCVQSGVKFDSFGLQIFMGTTAEGMFVRDMMQISSKLDEFATFSKPVHITGVSVPSSCEADPQDQWSGNIDIAPAGSWRKPWTPDIQADWLEHFYRLALSKPYVATVCWRDLSDSAPHAMPHGGLCDTELQPKPSFDRLRKFRSAMNRRPTKASKGSKG